MERILRGGFPLAVARASGPSRNRWFDDYLELVLERDVAELSSIRQREKMPPFRLPAWGTTLRARSSAKPKVHFVDSGLAGRMLRVTEARLGAAQPQAMTELGHLLETFCVGEILKQASWMASPPQPGHWRTHDGDEVDLVLERDDGALAGIEVKAGERVSADQFRSLRKLREAFGDRFLGGVVLHLGSRAYTQDDRLHAIPVDRLWLA